MAHAALKRLLHRNAPRCAMSAVGSTRDLKDALNELQIWSAPPSGADLRCAQTEVAGKRCFAAQDAEELPDAGHSGGRQINA